MVDLHCGLEFSNGHWWHLWSKMSFHLSV